MKIGIIGSGAVGTALAVHLQKAGHEIKYGSRDPASYKIKTLLEQHPGASAGQIADTVAWAEAVILAAPGLYNDHQIVEFARSLGTGVDGKLVLDAMNPTSNDEKSPVKEIRWKQGTSGGEVLAAALPAAYVYKAWNTVGAEQMVHPDGSLISGERLVMMYAGATEKKHIAGKLVEDSGFVPAYVGPIRFARNLEAIAELWIHLAYSPVSLSTENWGLEFHFQAIRKKD